MKPHHIHPELRAAARLLPPTPIQWMWFLKLLRFAQGLPILQTKCVDGVLVEDIKIGERKARLYFPEGTRPTAGVLWVHGGGFVSGNEKFDNFVCSSYAKNLNIIVCSAGYRLAPEYPFPAGRDDCFAAWNWFRELTSDLEIRPDRLAVAGISGGGGMAASLVQYIHKQGGIQPAAQFLFCPMLDDRTALKRELDKMNHVAWNNKNNRAAWTWYLGTDAGSEHVPKGSVPARSDELCGLPATWIGCGNLDLFYEESRLYADKLTKAGVRSVFDSVDGAFHGFEILVQNSELSRKFFDRHFSFAREVLHDADC
mgnify:CR=1 FL=1